MIRLPDHPSSGDLQRAREELSTAWAHLVTAAGQVEHASRRRGALARDRAVAARRAARGELPEFPWRWVGLGLAAGLVLGAAGTAAALIRRHARGDQAEPGPVHGTAASVRERATAAVHNATSAVHGAASAAKDAAAAARDTVGKVRDKVGGDADPEGGPPPAPEPSRPS
ncbi:MAG: hypothetical protein GEV12_23455 [Micromonosporaceae bacterium]|nr:hypothetical protein [Micromonosporaceae bacterium]